MVSAVPADATEVPTSRQNLQHLRFTRYRAVKWIQILKTKQKFPGKKIN